MKKPAVPPVVRVGDPKPVLPATGEVGSTASVSQKYLEELRRMLQQRLDGIERHIFVRRPDLTLLVRPLTVCHVNEYIIDFLEPLYRVRGIRVPALIKVILAKYPLSEVEILQRYHALLDDISALIRQDYINVKNMEVRPLQGIKDLLPTMGEIAITEVCNNRCRFCYMGLDTEYTPRKPLTMEEFKVVIDRIWFEAQAPSLNFTGGEPTLSRDLPGLLQHAAGLGFKTVVITNGRRLADDAYLRELISAGVNGFQVSIEAADPATHDTMVGIDGAWAETVQGIKNCQARMKTDVVTQLGFDLIGLFGICLIAAFALFITEEFVGLETLQKFTIFSSLAWVVATIGAFFAYVGFHLPHWLVKLITRGKGSNSSSSRESSKENRNA